MHAPTTWKLRDSKHFCDPRKLENIDECNELFRQQRLFVMDSCRHLITACKKPRLIRYIAGTPQELRDLCAYLDAFRYPIHRAQAALEPKRKDRSGWGSAGNRQPVRCSTGATNQPAGGKAFGSKR